MKLQTILLVAVLAFLVGASLPLTMPEVYSSIKLPEFRTGASSNVSSENTQAFFCPQDSCAQKLVGFYSTASKSIHVMVYSFTKQEIADSLIAAKARGVEVKVLMDNTQAGLKDAKDEYLLQNGIEVKIADMPGRHIFHDKVSVIDSNAFSTGSFNYTGNADSGNAENLVIVKDEKLAQAFEEEFLKYWNSN